MGSVKLARAAQPNTPAAGDFVVYPDIADDRIKLLKNDALVRILESVEWPKNHLINSGFNFAQRQVPGTLTTYSSVGGRVYSADRWWISNENASVQYQQIDTIAAPEGAVAAGFVHRYYGRFKKITAGGKFAIGQIETAENMAPLRGRRVRLEVWMKRTVAAAMSVRLGLVQLNAAGVADTVPINAAAFITAWGAVGTDPTLGASLAYIAPVASSADGGAIAGNGLTCALTGAMVRYSACFDIPADAKNLVAMVWTDGQPAANDELNVGQFGLYDGTEIPDWISNPQIAELDRCNRFYAKSFPLAIAPAQNGGLTGSWRGNAAQAGAVAFVHGFIPFPVQMRAVPAVTFYNPAAANAFLRYPITPSDATATSATQVSERGTEVTATGLAAWIAGGGVAIHYSADAEL